MYFFFLFGTSEVLIFWPNLVVTMQFLHLDRVYLKLPEQIWASEAKNRLSNGQLQGTNLADIFVIFAC